MSMSTLTPLTLDQFREWFPKQSFAHGNPTATCLHNTDEPDIPGWHGLASMQGIRRFHMQSRGYSDIAANLYIAPDNLIWTARPFDRNNWAHGLVEKPWQQVHADARAYCAGDVLALNKRAVGVEVVGDYDREDPLTSKAMLLALDVFAVMHEAFTIPMNRLLCHRMVKDTSCPGNKVSLDWVRGEVGKRMGQSEPSGELLVIGPDGQVVDCDPELVGGVTRVDIVPVAAACGFVAHWRPDPPQGPRVYLKKEG